MSTLDLILSLATILALAALFGGKLFFSFVAAPAVHRNLPAEIAAEFLRALFPLYYLVAALVAFAGAAFAAAINPYAAAILAILALSYLYARFLLLPRVNRARDQGPEGRPVFVKLHKQSLYLNFGQLAVVVVMLIFMVTAWPIQAYLHQ